MGNCPSLNCEPGEKKICFRDNDEARTKLGFCLNEENMKTAKKIADGTDLCPACPPPCPTPGFNFLGKNLGTIDDPALKDYLNFLMTGYSKGVCSNSSNANRMAIDFLMIGRDPEDFDINNMLFDTYISETKEFAESMSPTPGDQEFKERITLTVDFLESHKSEFSTDDVLDFQKLANFIKKSLDTVCSSTTTPETDSYTGKFSKNNLLNFIVLLVLLVIVHLMLVRK